MIFIAFFGLIALIVIALNVLDSNNINKIEDYLKVQECNTVHYNEGVFQALCNNKVILIDNGFSVDINKDKKLILYKEIKNINKEKNKLVLITKDDKITLTFKEEKEQEDFFKKVKEKYE